ncbi:hypothetical protein [Burkholderia multivorans]|uniref:hypothetical protein n=1 Tax=Burkholderia multivorans TaxID=87883 RepID=UPI001C26637A|nr:hypothetical protein [Burkholderia multivorans]MBU9552614.1 hypothetical protein [Burkholderia multivorans]MCA8317389.1 hypothetical protein [Burkholderia multivorans]
MTSKLTDEQIEAAKEAGFYWHPIQKCLCTRHSSGAWVSVDDMLARFVALLATTQQPNNWSAPCSTCSTPRACQYDGCRQDALAAQRPSGEVTAFTTTVGRLLATAPHFEECETPEPCLSALIHRYYENYFDREKGREHAELYIAALYEAARAQGGES